MDLCDRKTIFDNMEKLLESTEYQELVRKCQEHKLLSNVMVSNLEHDAGDETKTRHRHLLMKLTQRGPKAFDVLLDICKDLGYTEAYKLLKPFSYSGDIDIKKEKQKQNRNITPTIKITRPSTSDGPITLTPYEEPVPRKYNVEKTSRICVYPKDDIHLETYEMSGSSRGVLFLVNIIDFQKESDRRNGATSDKENLIDLFRQMGFKIFYYENLYRDQFDLLLESFSRSPHLRKPDCLVFGLLTHGNVVGNTAYAEFTDGGSYKVEDVIQFFSNSKCQFLIGKPKIFLFPFCRGDKPDQEVNIMHLERRVPYEYDGAGRGTITQRYPTFSDIIICYATVPGYETHRDPEDGSWYIQKFCTVLEKYAHKVSLEEMLKKIHLMVGEMTASGSNIQTPSFESRGFNKVLYFNPGCYPK